MLKYVQNYHYDYIEQIVISAYFLIPQSLLVGEEQPLE